ncbi:hypothetical protein ACF9IK_03785 [Kitasatospora hibisci]|uniref:hypothetical protein n=1 Tax=Kitasatospora hibisci TaxID=3369522 RepID=UPI00375459F9
MDGPALSGRERRLLEEIECDLRQDTKLDRRLSTMGAKQPSRVRTVLQGAARKVPPGVLMTALVMSAICLSIGVRAPTTAAVVTVAVVWAASVGIAFGVAVVLRRRRPGAEGGSAGGGRTDGDRADGTGRTGGGWWTRLDRRDGRDRGDGRDRQDPPERRPWDRPEA